MFLNVKEFLCWCQEVGIDRNLEMYIIEIPKARKILEKEPNNKLAQWVMFLNNPNESEISQIMEENKEIKKAMEELEEISKNKELRFNCRIARKSNKR